MDKVTQNNAANAEESASASEEMRAQAEKMKDVVGDLRALVDGSGGKIERGEDEAIRKEAVAGKTGIESHKALSGPVKKSGEKETKPYEVIPMDEGDFKDF